MKQVTIPQVRQWLKGFTYKPDWKFEVQDEYGYEFMRDEVIIHVTACVADVNSVGDFKTATLMPADPFQYQYEPFRSSGYSMKRPVEYSNVIGRMIVPFYVNSRQQFYGWLLSQGLWALEGHEMLEWARVDGKPIFDPHPNGGSTSKAGSDNYTLGAENG